VDQITSTEARVFVRGALAPGEKVVTSRIATPVAGMTLRPGGNGAPAGPDAGAPP
jgi:hypothetical protein